MQMDIDLLKSLISYDPGTGALKWKPRPASAFCVKPSWLGRVSQAWNTANAGREIQSFDTWGYVAVHVKIGGLRYRMLGHRVAWAITHGKWPDDVIDHINGRPADNRLCNLRSCTISENNRNQKLSARNTSGKIGVTFFARTQKWHAWIRINGVSKSLGYHERFDDAVAARIAAENRQGFFEAERHA